MALLSRVADSLFWLGRYVERAESTARLLDVTFHARLEPTTADTWAGSAAQVIGATNTWEALLTTVGVEDDQREDLDTTDETAVIEFLTVSRTNPSSIVSALTAARENARGVRDLLSSEAWVAINRLHHSASHRSIHLILADGLYDFCDEVRLGAQHFHGTVDSTSLHDEGWHWLKAGLYVERCDMVTRIVDSKYHLLFESVDEVGGAVDRFQWSALLRSLSAFEAFQRTHVRIADPTAIVEFLLFHPEFPRSLRACLDALTASLDHATLGAERRQRNKALRLISELSNRLSYESIETVMAAGLHEFLEETQGTLARACADLSEAFFWPAGTDAA